MWALEEVAPGVQRAPITRVEESYGPVATPARLCQRAGCENPLTGRQAKWCSQNCRKRACDDAHRAHCERCGVALHSRSGWSNVLRPQRRCVPCEAAVRAAAHDARLREFADMYNAGVPMTEITARLGWSETSTPGGLCREARERGLIGYRYQGCEGRNVAA